MKHTKGKLEIEKGWNNAEVHIMHKDNTIIICRSIGAGIPSVDALANAELISEAFNVTNETGYTPRQLANQLSEHKKLAEREIKKVLQLAEQKAELLKELTLTYLRLQIESLLNVGFAVTTDYMRASLRSKISDITGTPGQLVQDKIESIARDLRDKKIYYKEAIKNATL